jgi:hypothetical protein
MNAPAPFFPFGPKEGGPPVLLNKREVLFVTVAAAADAGDLPEGTESPSRRVAIEAESQRLEGIIVVDLPQDHTRVLDYLNRPLAFVTLRDDDRHHLIQKERITRVLEIPEQ